jgi:hypothetical protein
MISRIILSLALAALLPGNASADASDLEQRELASKAVTAEFLKQLGGKLKAEMKASGPVGAIAVCRDVAPDIANELSLKNGWRVTRVSSKPRNSMLGTADTWEHENLADFERRAMGGESYKDMVSSQVVLEGGKSYYRFMKPIPVQEICLTCHGSEEQIPPAVAAALAEAYPHDKAKGYKLGDLRGAVSIKQPIETPLHSLDQPGEK